MDNIRMIVEDLPELETEVAISGSVKQQEVGGGVCLGIAAGIAIYASW
jgi:O-acetyl-ADP-ribose deacetylase (regulator of RNase III)